MVKIGVIYIIFTFFCTIQAQIQQHSDEILFGQTCSLSGHFAYYGTAIQHGILACFNEINAKGGINGKKLRLITLDDHGDIKTAQDNITTLRNNYHISMLLGIMRTRTALSLLPDIKKGNLALFFLWGSDNAFNDPTLTHVINGPGLVQPQINALVNHIKNNLPLRRVAIFRADDNFTSQATHNLRSKLKDYGVEADSIHSYNRFTMDIKSPAQKLIASNPRAVVCLATGMPTVKLINYFFEQGHFGTLFLGIDSTFLVPEILRTKGARFQFASAVPHPTTSTIPLAQNYKKSLATYFPDDDPSILSFTYYISAMIIVHAIKNIEGTITKEKIIEEISNMKNYDLLGFLVNFNQDTRHAFGYNTWII